MQNPIKHTPKLFRPNNAFERSKQRKEKIYIKLASLQILRATLVTTMNNASCASKIRDEATKPREDKQTIQFETGKKSISY